MNGMMTHTFKVGLTVLVLVSLSGAVQAMQPMALPAFQVTAPDETLVNSQDLALTGRWLLVYVKADCAFCDTVLHLLKKDGTTSAGQCVVIVGGRAERRTAQADRFPDLAGASWYSDSFEEAFPALGLNGVPVVMGMQDDVVQWSISGTTLNADDLKVLLNTWLAGG